MKRFLLGRKGGLERKLEKVKFEMSGWKFEMAGREKGSRQNRIHLDGQFIKGEEFQ